MPFIAKRVDEGHVRRVHGLQAEQGKGRAHIVSDQSILLDTCKRRGITRISLLEGKPRSVNFLTTGYIGLENHCEKVACSMFPFSCVGYTRHIVIELDYLRPRPRSLS